MQKILVIDDSQAFTSYLGSLLNEHGYQATSSTDPASLIPLLHNQHQDLVLLDISMPEIDGVTLLKRIRADSRLQHVEVMMVTATNEDRVLVDCLNSGAVDYITKPINEVVLLARVGAALERIEHQRTQEKLSNSVAHYNAIVESSADGIISTDEHGVIRSFNPAAEKIFNYSAKEIIGNYASIFSIDNAEQNNDAGHRIYQGHAIKEVLGKTIEIEVKRKGGEIFPAELSVSEINFNRRKGYAGIIRDISEKKKAAAELSRLNSYLDTVLFNLPLGVAILEGEDFRYFRINQALAALNGQPVAEHLGKRLVDMVPSSDVELVPKLREVLASNKPILGREFSIQLPSSSDPIHLMDWHVPIVSPDKDLNTIISVVLDVTELNEAQEQLIQSQKMESLGVLAGGIAHEFNNLLAIIMGNAELAFNIFPKDNRNRVKEVTIAGEKAAKLVNQMLAFSKTDSDHQKPLDLIECIKNSLEMAQSLTPHNIEIHLDFDNDCPPIMANEAQIYQIILNLCSNAFNAMESEGGVIEISVKEVDDRLVLTFKDSGIGIESGNRKWIFDPFFNGKTIGKGKGTGLGLSVIYRLIEAHNGTINIDSKHDIGTTVTITIPTVMEGAANSDEAHSANKGPGRILIADDEIGLLALYKEILESENYEVTIKENGADALATFRENPDFFDLVITDQTMPKMTGKELAMNLLQIRPELPIIMTSGYDQSLRSEQVNTDSIRCYLQKPIGLRQLVDAVQIQLEAGQLG